MFISRIYQKVESCAHKCYSTVKKHPYKTMGVLAAVGSCATFVLTKASSPIRGPVSTVLTAVSAFFLNRPTENNNTNQQQQSAGAHAANDNSAANDSQQEQSSSSQSTNKSELRSGLASVNENKNSCQPNNSSKNVNNVKIPGSAIPSQKIEIFATNLLKSLKNVTGNTINVHYSPQVHVGRDVPQKALPSAKKRPPPLAASRNSFSKRPEIAFESSFEENFLQENERLLQENERLLQEKINRYLSR